MRQARQVARIGSAPVTFSESRGCEIAQAGIQKRMSGRAYDASQNYTAEWKRTPPEGTWQRSLVAHRLSTVIWISFRNLTGTPSTVAGRYRHSRAAASSCGSYIG